MKVVLWSLTVVAVMSGCGGGDRSTNRHVDKTRAQFIAEGDALCKASNAKAKNLNQRVQAAASSSEDSTEQFRAIAPIMKEGVATQRASLRKWEALVPPKADQAVFDKLTEAYEEQTALVARLADAISNEDADRVTAITEEQERVTEGARGLAQGYGFHECGSGANEAH